jgi:aminocarboxymuconate-semialdehyde decarboxylase
MGSLIDVHAHVCPEHLPSLGAVTPSRWPCMHHADGLSSLYVGDTKFRDLDDRSWSAQRRMEHMDRDGVSLQALSPMPELLSYWFTPGEAHVICDAVNGQIAEIVARHPDRFAGLGMAPLQDPAAAARALGEFKSRFGLAGVEIGSNINGVLLGDPRFEVFYEAAEDLGLAVFVHALHPLSTRPLTDNPLAPSLIGFPLDMAITAASIIKAGVLERFPRLKIAFSHGGGALGAIIGRLDQGWRMIGGDKAGLPRPSEVARRMFYDSNVYDPMMLAHLVRTLAPGNIFLGTDYPYPIMQEAPATYLAACPLSAPERESLLHEAASRFLGLSSEP